MSKSVGEAMAKRETVVWTKTDELKPCQVFYQRGEEKEAIGVIVRHMSSKQAVALLEVIASEMGLQLVPYPEKS